MTDASLNAQDLPSDQGAISTKTVLEGLSALCNKIARIVEEGKGEGVLRPTQEIYTRFSIERYAFEETPLGLKRVDFTPEEFSKESWFQATRTVVWRLQESDDYCISRTCYAGLT